MTITITPSPAREGALASLLRTKTARSVLGAHAVLGVALVAAPLVDVLGFERALATSLLAAGTSPILGARAARAGRARRTEPMVWWGAAIVVGLLGLMPSLVAGLTYEALTLPCDVETGILFFLLVGGGNVVFGVTLGFVSDVALARRPTHVLAVLTAWTVDLVWLAAALARLYREPQIFVYATPLGFWPGSIYDEQLAAGPALWGFRAFGLGLSVGLACLTRSMLDPDGQPRLRPPRPGWAAAGVLGLGCATWAHAAGRQLGFDLDRGDVVEALSHRVETEHFVLQVDPTVDARDVEALAQEHELIHRQLVRFFGRAPSGKITSFVHRDELEKGRLIGAANTQFARPWAREIHVHGAEVPHPVLRHELAHVFAAELAAGPLRVPLLLAIVPNIGLIEGLAVAADWPTQELTVHEWAAAMRKLGALPPVAGTLDPSGFWRISSSRAYVATGSFVRWLIDRHGMDRFAPIYRSRGFEETLGAPAAELERAWHDFLAEVPLDDAVLRKAAHRFARPSIFAKTCARASATLASSAYERLRAGDVEGAAPLIERLQRLQPAEPSPILALARARLRRGQLDPAQALVARARATQGATEKAQGEALEIEGELAWKRGDHARAAEIFAAVLALRLSTASERLQSVRLAVLEREEPVRETLRAYLSGEMRAGQDLVKVAALARSEPGDPVIAYLYARRLEGANAPDEGLAALSDSDALPLGPLRDEAGMMLGRLAFAAGRLEDASRLFARVVVTTGRAAVAAEAREWVERSDHALEWNRGSTPSRSGG